VILAIASAECCFSASGRCTIPTRFSADGVAAQPSGLNRRNAEMQLKRAGVAATRVGANGPTARSGGPPSLDAAYKHYYLAVRYGKQALGAHRPLPYPSTAVFGGPAASNVFFENTQKAFK